MNRIVRENYPVSKLPEDLRGDIAANSRVKIVVEIETGGSCPPVSVADLKQQIDEMKSQPDFRPATAEEAVARIRALRDEWDT